MKVEEVKEYIDTFSDKFDGNRSLLYPYIKDIIDQYPCCDIPFPQEFLYFEDLYVSIYKDIRKRGINAKNIIDIGCQFGIQSEIFRHEYNYTGIELYDMEFFNKNTDNCSFLIGAFPNQDINYEDSIIISSMSLGYFPQSDNEDEELELLAKELNKCKYLYIATSIKFRKVLSKYFEEEHIPKIEYNSHRKSKPLSQDIHDNLFYLKRKETI